WQAHHPRNVLLFAKGIGRLQKKVLFLTTLDMVASRHESACRFHEPASRRLAVSVASPGSIHLRAVDCADPSHIWAGLKERSDHMAEKRTETATERGARRAADPGRRAATASRIIGICLGSFLEPPPLQESRGRAVHELSTLRQLGHCQHE